MIKTIERETVALSPGENTSIFCGAPSFRHHKIVFVEFANHFSILIRHQNIIDDQISCYPNAFDVNRLIALLFVLRIPLLFISIFSEAEAEGFCSSFFW